MIKNLNTENGVTEIERIEGSAVVIAADLACIAASIFSLITEEWGMPKEIAKELFIRTLKNAVEETPVP